jgi:polyphosphate glucokinase
MADLSESRHEAATGSPYRKPRPTKEHIMARASAKTPPAPTPTQPEMPIQTVSTDDVESPNETTAHAIEPVARAIEAVPIPTAEPPNSAPAPQSILVVDIGGTNVKMLAAGHTKPRKARTGKTFTPAKLIDTVRELAVGWEYDAITVGYPGLVGSGGPKSEPGNLGAGWVGFDFAAAFGKPVKIVNDAAMQALGSYDGGRMLFLGLGTGLGSTLIAGHVIIQLELGQIQYNTRFTLNDFLSRRGLARLGKNEWRKKVTKAVTALMHAFIVDYVVIGGGLAKKLKDPPPGVRLGHNLTAFRGGMRLWNVKDAWVLALSGGETSKEEIRLV